MYEITFLVRFNKLLLLSIYIIDFKLKGEGS